MAKIEHLAFKNQAGRSKPRLIPKLQDLFAVSLTVAHENGNNLCFLSHFTTNWDEYKKDLGELRKTIYEHQCDHIELYGWEFNPGVEFYWDNRGKKPVCSVALKAKNKGKDNPELIAERAAVSRSYESMAELNLPNCDSIDIRWQEAK
ncbi:hypothetical protein [Shewanella algae]|uniref:hypothetical protein n=1 Tax=Shewanella algae TaxID=38313 RepID=UPI001AAFD2E5|nr:hypothetical protein [Shewanella algae]MBO2661440.1 hypothetical protein [Shewanella algae]MCL1054477.1 hypothetical protein [Shewanella algae]